jgi:hypothetical protein
LFYRVLIHNTNKQRHKNKPSKEKQGVEEMRKETKKKRRKMREKALKLYASGDWRKNCMANMLMKNANKKGRWPNTTTNY